MRRALTLLPLALLAMWPRASGAAPREPIVDVVKVSGVIDRPVAGYLEDTIARAERDDAQVVIQLDSPGTLGVSPESLGQFVFDASVPVVVWVGPSGARAQGSALMLLYASSLSVVSPGAGVGPLEPIDLGAKPSGEDPASRRAALQAIDGWATARGRDPAFASSGREVPAQGALDAHVAELAAASIPDLLLRIDGRTVPSGPGIAVLATRASGGRPVLVRFHELGIGRRIVHGVASPVAIYVLIVLGAMGVAFELTQTGIGAAGIAGVVALGLAAYGLTLVPFDGWGLGLLVAGVLLLQLDVRLRRLGPITALGMAGFVAGTFLVFHRVAAAIDLPLWLEIVSPVAAFLFWGFALTVAMRSRERITLAQQGLIGLVGEARGELAPEGPVYVKGAMWRARSGNGPIPPGTRIRVRGVDGLILRVEPEEE